MYNPNIKSLLIKKIYYNLENNIKVLLKKVILEHL